MDQETILKFRKGMLILGGVIVALSAGLLLYFGVIVFQIIHHPNDVQLIRYATEHLQGDGRAIYGTLAGQKLEVNLSEDFHRHVFLVIGVIVLAMLVGILKSIISAGLALINYGLGRVPKPGTSGDEVLPALNEGQ